MKLKCWKQIYKGKNMVRFGHVNTPEQVEIYTERIDGKNIPFVAVNGKEFISDKELKDKIQAKNVAIKYMRKHDSGC